ncbi:plasmid transfer operon protein, partial [Desulfacinum hydrothermale DSM 13146]
MRLYLHIVAYMVAWSIGITMALHVPSGEVRAANTLDESVYSGKEEGWFFYKDPVDQEQKQEEQKEPPASLPVQETESPKKFERQSVLVSQPEKPKPLSVRWIRENLPKLLDTAIDDPTPENVAAYLYAHRIMMDKAQNFAKVSYRVSRLDPLLNEETRFPFSNAMRAGFFRLQNEAKKAALKEDIARKAG